MVMRIMVLFVALIYFLFVILYWADVVGYSTYRIVERISLLAGVFVFGRLVFYTPLFKRDKLAK